MKHNRFLTTLVAVLVLAPASLAFAAGAQVVDNAGFFSSDAVSKANQELAAIHDKYGKDLRVETYATIPEDLRDKYTPDQKAKFYSAWAYKQAKAAGVDGAIVLITRDPSYLQVDVGEATRKQAFTLEDRNRLRDSMLRDFKAKRYDEGLLGAVDTFRSSLETHRAAAPAGSVTHSRPVSPGFSMGKVLFWGALIFLGLMFVRWMIGRRTSGYANYQNPNQPDPGQDPRNYGGSGYGGGGYGGGGFGRGLGGGILGGLLGSWIGGHVFGQNQSYGAPPPPPADDQSAGGGAFGDTGASDFSSDSGGYQDIGGGGDFGGGGDMGGGGGGDSGGGGDF
jgi:hypothetical protein